MLTRSLNGVKVRYNYENQCNFKLLLIEILQYKCELSPCHYLKELTLWRKFVYIPYFN